ncbi:MAG: ABC transporter permease, partial [Anaerolineae bacterium]
GIYSATHKYSFGDNLFTVVAFMGLGLPDFLLALVFLVVALKLTGSVPTGLFSSQYEGAPWSLAKLADLLKHMWVPAAIIAISSTAGLIRTMRGNLLDTLRLNYVQAARAKGLKEGAVIRKHAVRNALHPIVMGIGMDLPYVVSGSEITAIVLGLPTTGPLYLQAMQQQDMLLGSTMLMLLSATLVVGNFLADMLLLWLDPRIRYD